MARVVVVDAVMRAVNHVIEAGNVLKDDHSFGGVEMRILFFVRPYVAETQNSGCFPFCDIPVTR